MQHLTLKATTTETEEELGVFKAIVSAWVEDRVKDVILPTAFEKIRTWLGVGQVAAAPVRALDQGDR